MIYEVTDIKYDTDGEPMELPEVLNIEVSDDLDEQERVDFVSDEISNITGFCHFGFNMTSK